MPTEDLDAMDDARPARRVGVAAFLVAALWALPGCAVLGLSEGSGMSFFTEPPGARVVVDRKDSGFVTPCRLTIEKGRKHRVDLEMPGYETVTVRVERALKKDVILWRDMYVRAEIWRFPLWLNLEDAVEPVRVREALEPGHVFVRLERAAQQ